MTEKWGMRLVVTDMREILETQIERYEKLKKNPVPMEGDK